MKLLQGHLSYVSGGKSSICTGMTLALYGRWLVRARSEQVLEDWSVFKL